MPDRIESEPVDLRTVSSVSIKFMLRCTYSVFTSGQPSNGYIISSACAVVGSVPPIVVSKPGWFAVAAR